MIIHPTTQHLINISFIMLAYVMIASSLCAVHLPKSIKPFSNSTLLNHCDVIISDVDVVKYLLHCMENIFKSRQHTHVTFLHEPLYRRLLQAVKAHQVKVINVHPSTCHLSTGDANCNINLYEHVLLEIFELLPGQQRIGIVSITKRTLFDHKSSNEFPSGPFNKLRKNHYSTFIIPRFRGIDQIKDILRDIKRKSLTFVALLLDQDMINLFLDVAQRSHQEGRSRVWLTLDGGRRTYVRQGLEILSLRMDIIQRKHQPNPDCLLQVNSVLLEMIGSIQSSSPKAPCHYDHQKEVSVYGSEGSEKFLISTQWQLMFKWSQSKLHVETGSDLFLKYFAIPPSEIRKIKVVSIIDPPFTMLVHHYYDENIEGKCEHGILCSSSWTNQRNENDWKESCCIGMSIDMLKLVADKLNFKPCVNIVEDGFYGRHDEESGESNGMVHELISKNAELAVGALIPTYSLLRHIDFTQPYMEASIGIIVSIDSQSGGFFNMEFLEPLGYDLRYWIAATFLVGTLLVYILENQRLALLRIIEPNAYPRYSWREGFSYFSGLAFQRDLGGRNPQRLGARVTAVVFAFGMVIIMTTYTAVLTASNISETKKHPTSRFLRESEIFHPSSDKKYATVSKTAVEYLYSSYQKNDHRRMSRYNVNATAEGITKLKKGELDGFIFGTPFLKYYLSKQKKCKLKLSGVSAYQQMYSFALPKDSPWTSSISRTLLELKEDQIVDQIYKKWFPPSICEEEKSGSTKYKSVELKYFGGLIVVLAVSICISFLLLGLEHFCYRHHRRVINPLQEKVQVWREAGRRNALVDPQHIKEVQRKQRRPRLNMLPKLKKRTMSVGQVSVISEGEDELIRMRIRQRSKRNDKEADPLPLPPPPPHIPTVYVEDEEVEGNMELTPTRRSLSDIVSVFSTQQSVTNDIECEDQLQIGTRRSVTPSNDGDDKIQNNREYVMTQQTE